MRIRPLSLLLAPALLAAPALAQEPCLVQKGGGLGKPASFEISGGDPFDFWFLLFAVSEAPTVAFGANLDIPIDLFQFSLDVGAFGFLDANGAGGFATTVPANPSFAGSNFRAQAALGFLPDDQTNLTRLVLSQPQTFRPTVAAPSALASLAGGVVLPGDKGALEFVGGSGLTSTTFDPRLEEWTDGVLPFAAPSLTTSTKLADGRVLFAGGLDIVSGAPTNQAFVYDPSTGTSLAVTMNNARLGHSATLLNNGKVFVAGGLQTIGIDLSDPASLLDPATLLGLANDIQATTELFDPLTNTFTPAANMPEKRVLHTATLRQNGNVLLAGGISVIPFINVPTVSSTANDYNPNTNAFPFFPAFMGTARAGHEAVATPDGRVLMIGGLTADFSTFLTTGNVADIVVSSVASIERFTANVIGGSFAVVGALQEGRALCSALLLPGSQVLVAGGFALDLTDPLAPLIGASNAADLYRGVNDVIAVGDLATPRTLPLMVRLDTGAVLVAGGLAGGAEIYQP
jgi:hypothetical protein